MMDRKHFQYAWHIEGASQAPGDVSAFGITFACVAARDSFGPEFTHPREAQGNRKVAPLRSAQWHLSDGDILGTVAILAESLQPCLLKRHLERKWVLPSHLQLG